MDIKNIIAAEKKNINSLDVLRFVSVNKADPYPSKLALGLRALRFQTLPLCGRIKGGNVFLAMRTYVKLSHDHIKQQTN